MALTSLTEMQTCLFKKVHVAFYFKYTNIFGWCKGEEHVFFTELHNVYRSEFEIAGIVGCVLSYLFCIGIEFICISVGIYKFFLWDEWG